MVRKKLIAANWKMNKSIRESEDFTAGLKSALDGIPDCGLVLFPPFLSLPAVARALNGTDVKTGAQDLFWEEEGAFTGEISSRMIEDVGGTYVIIGHSERRTVIGESDELVARKLRAALTGGLTPILCVGEHLTEREAGRAETIVQSQLEDALSGLSSGQASEIVIAYEPIWAIGTGKTATPEDAEQMHRFIRHTFNGMFGEEVAGNLTIQYGGSVKPSNAKDLLEKPDIDGALIGGASLDVDSFLAIIRAVPVV